MIQTVQHRVTELSIIIVNMNGWHVLQKCLTTLYQHTVELDFEVIVVDNASTDGSKEIIVQKFPQIKLILNSNNLGFASANNCGIKEARGKFVLLLNPDTEILDGALQKAVNFMRQNPNCGIVGCKLLNSDGTIQQTVRSFPSIWNVFCEAFFLYLLMPNSRLFGRYHMKYFDYSHSSSVDWLLGAFLLIRRNVFETIGILDEQFFMYTEEVDYCYRAKQVGFDVVYYPDARVYHHWSGPKVTKPFLIYWGHRSQILYFKKHFSFVERNLSIIIKYTGLFLRVIIYFVIGILSFNKKLIRKSYACVYTIIKLSFSM